MAMEEDPFKAASAMDVEEADDGSKFLPRL
jgi:hypothetical protein